MTNLRTLLWVYMWLLMFEGALRKWGPAGLDAPLLIIRDPLVIWIYFLAVQRHFSFNNGFFLPNLALAIATAILAELFGSANFVITLYGLRTDYLQIPLIFLIPQILDRDDVIAMGRFMLYATIPIAALVLVQFRSPQDSFINKGALNTWYGTVRPSGPFSFIAGLVCYFALISSFLFYGFLQARTYKNWLLAAVTVALLLASFCSGSRSCIVSIGIVIVVAILCVITRGKGGNGLIVAAILIAFLVPVLSCFSVFQTGTEQLTQRIEDGAQGGEDTSGFAARYVNTMLKPLYAMDETPIFGNGLGLGTNAAAGLLRGGREFIGPEDEWGRLIWECGPIFGLLLCIFRTALTLAIARRAYEAFQQDNILPVLIFAACGLLILNGQWGVPTTLGFAIFGGGLTLAACVEPHHEDDEEHDHEHDDHDEHHDHADDEPDHSTEHDTVS